MILKKILGPLFSIIGKLGLFGVFAAFAITVSAAEDAQKAGVENLAFAVIGIILAVIFSKIGDKLTDSGYKKGGWLAFKRRAYGVFNFIFSKIGIFRVLLFAAGVIGLWSGIALIVSIFTKFNVVFYKIVYLSWSIGFPCVFILTYLENYIECHCKNCGANLKGCGYVYEAQDVTRNYDKSKDQVYYTSKVRFEVDCEECGTENIWYRKMKTDNESIEKYIRRIVGLK